MKCNHNNSFYIRQEEDDYERRLYDINYCMDCGTIHETRVYRGKHEYPSKEEYIKTHVNKT